MNMHPEIRLRSAQLETGVLVELFTLDLTALGGPVLYYHPYNKLAPQTITFQGHEYQPWPIKAEGWDMNTKGTLPRPTLSIANVGSMVSAFMRQYGDFIGAEVIHRKTYAQFLDGEPGANPQAEFIPNRFVVERKVSETSTVVQLELATLFDTEGVQLPRRQILSGYCPWDYRGVECGYTGPPVADEDDNPILATNDRGLYNAALVYNQGDYAYLVINGIRAYYASLINANTAPLTDKTSWVRDTCSKCLRACKMRFGEDNPLPFGGFPGASDTNVV